MVLRLPDYAFRARDNYKTSLPITELRVAGGDGAFKSSTLPGHPVGCLFQSKSTDHEETQSDPKRQIVSCPAEQEAPPLI